MKKLILFFSLIFSLAYAADIYVSSSGSDNASGAKSAPFKTINQAVSKSSPGDTVFVLPGSYAPAKFTKNGTAAKWITIKSTVKWGAKIETSGNTYCFTVQNSSYIAVDGFELTQQGAIANRSATGYGFLQTEGHHITVKNCYAHHCGGNGISMAYGDYFTVENNLCEYNSSWDAMQTSGISVYEPVASDNLPGFHIVIRNNISRFNVVKVSSPAGEYTDGNGIILDDFHGTQGNSGAGKYTPASLVERNIVNGNGFKGIQVFICSNVTVRNNTAYRNHRAPSANQNGNSGQEAGIQINWGDNCIIENNISVESKDVWKTPAQCYAAVYGPSDAPSGNFFRGNIAWPENGATAFSKGWPSNNPASFATADGNITADPMFVDAAKGDFSLKPGSPATGKGAVGGTVVVSPDPKPDPKPDPVACDTVYINVPGPVVVKTDTIYVAMQIDEAELVQAIEAQLLGIVIKNKVTISLNKKQQASLLAEIQAYIAKLNEE